MPKNIGDLGKFIVAKGFKKLPKVQKITQSGHTAPLPSVSSQRVMIILAQKNAHIHFVQDKFGQFFQLFLSYETN